jgi:hypothetical protein
MSALPVRKPISLTRRQWNACCLNECIRYNSAQCPHYYLHELELEQAVRGRRRNCWAANYLCWFYNTRTTDNVGRVCLKYNQIGNAKGCAHGCTYAHICLMCGSKRHHVYEESGDAYKCLFHSSWLSAQPILEAHGVPSARFSEAFDRFADMMPTIEYGSHVDVDEFNMFDVLKGLADDLKIVCSD